VVGNGKIEFRFFFGRQLSEIRGVLRVSFEVSSTLCFESRIGSSFYPTASMVYLD